MKKIFIGIGKACLYITILVLVFWVLTGFGIPTQLEIAGLLAIGVIILKKILNNYGSSYR